MPGLLHTVKTALANGFCSSNLYKAPPCVIGKLLVSFFMYFYSNLPNLFPGLSSELSPT